MSVETVFPLSFSYGELEEIPHTYKQKMVERIKTLLPDELNKREWFGDISQNPCLHSLNEFDWLTKSCELKIKEYVDQLGFNIDELAFHHQRSWVNLIKCGGAAPPHKHVSSNITFAFCFYKDPNSNGGNIILDNTSYQNLIMPGLDIVTGMSSLFKDKTIHNYNSIVIPINTGSYIVFPSKTQHLTQHLVNTNEDMIVLTYDILVTTALHVNPLKYSFIPPHPNNYKEF